MPKQPPIEFVELKLRFPKQLLGEVLGDANARGISDFSVDFVTAVATYKQRNTNPDVSSDDFLANWTKDHPTFKAKEAVHAFRDDGRGNGTTAYHALTKAVETGLLKKIGEGMYARADVKALPSPKTKTKAKADKRLEPDHRTFILRAASRNHGHFNTAWMKQQFVKDGRVPGNVSPTISALMKKKQLKRVSDSEYELVPKKTNGAAAPEVVANG